MSSRSLHKQCWYQNFDSPFPFSFKILFWISINFFGNLIEFSKTIPFTEQSFNKSVCWWCCIMKICPSWRKWDQSPMKPFPSKDICSEIFNNDFIDWFSINFAITKEQPVHQTLVGGDIRTIWLKLIPTSQDAA